MKLEKLQKLAASRNVSTNRDLFTSMDFDTMHIWLLVESQLVKSFIYDIYIY